VNHINSLICHTIVFRNLYFWNSGNTRQKASVSAFSKSSTIFSITILNLSDLKRSKIGLVAETHKVSTVTQDSEALDLYLDIISYYD